jgi:hypothetical protein
VDEHRQLFLAEAEHSGRRTVEEPVDALELDEVVARAHRSELSGAALARPLGDRGRVRLGEPALRLRPLDVLVPLGDRPRALAQHAVERVAPPVRATLLARPGRDRPRELVDERFAPAAQLLARQRQRQQPHAAVDVVAHAAGRDDAVRQLGRGEPADREAVALVDVRHRECRVDDPGQRGDVLELLERAVPGERVEQRFVGEDAGRDAHVGPRARRDLVQGLVDPPQQARHRARPARASRWAALRLRARGR